MKFDKGMTRFYADIGKAIALRIKPSAKLDELIKNGDPKPLREWLKNRFGESGVHDSDISSVTVPNKGLELEYNYELNNLGEHTLALTWSQLATLLRNDDFRKKYVFPNEQPEHFDDYLSQWEIDNNHFCGNYTDDAHCEFLLTSKKDTVVNGKKLDMYCAYCTSENKIRKINSLSFWTGLSPKFCPKRKALEKHDFLPIVDDFGRLMPKTSKEDKSAVLDYLARTHKDSKMIRVTQTLPLPSIEKEDKPMARKMEFDAAITKDMKSAASDSFVDNIKMIDINEIAPSRNNFYEISDVELLADDIEREGLKQSLVVVKDPDTGLYEVKGGHRRLAAIKLLISEKRRSSTKIPCYVDGEKSAAESQFDLIMLNATQRKYSDADTMREYEEIERTLKALESEGKPLKGRIRDNIAEILKVSPAQVGKIENIKHNAVPEVEKAVKSGEMSISTANEIAKLSEEKQQEIIKEKPKISNKEVKELQKQEKPAAPKITESDFDDDFDEDEDYSEEMNDEYSGEDDDISEDSAAEKESSVRVNFFLSASEAKLLVEFLDDNFVSGCDDNKIGAILDRLRGITKGF